MGPLQGLRVIEIEGLGPAPFCGMMLADMGAEVISIGRASSDAPRVDRISERGKRSVALNLKHPEGVEALLARALSKRPEQRPTVQEFRDGLALCLRGADAVSLSQREIFLRTTLRDRNLSSVTQAGLVNNLNDGMAWGLFPLVFAAAQQGFGAIGTLAAIYPATWGIAQLWTGAWSDRVGRKWLIVWGMVVQAVGIAVVAVASEFTGFATGAFLLGIGTAMVYPTLLAAIGDVAHPTWRASAVGVYRLWRDLGYAFGAVIAGVVADKFGVTAALWAVAALTLVSGLIAAARMRETHSARI